MSSLYELNSNLRPRQDVAFGNTYLSNLPNTLVLGTDASGKIIDGSGSFVFTYPFIHSFNNAVQTIHPNTQTLVNFNTDSSNIAWTTSRSDNTKFIAPKAGYYQVSYNVWWARPADDFGFILQSSIIFNGGNAITGTFVSPYANYNVGSHLPTQGINASGSGIIHMNGTTDYIQCNVFQDDGSDMFIGTNNSTEQPISCSISIIYLHP